MDYTVFIKRSAEKELDDIPARTRARIINRIRALGNNPRMHGVEKLQGQEAYRLRVGNYRVLFTIDDDESTVTINAVAHRREAYQ